MALIDLDQANAFETAALPGSGDVDAGAGGLTTSSMTNESALESYGLDTYSQSRAGDPPDNAISVAPHLAGTAVDHPFVTLAVLVAGAFVYKAVVKNESSENVKMSIPNFFGIGLVATAFILVEKWVFGVWQLPSITPTLDYL